MEAAVRFERSRGPDSRRIESGIGDTYVSALRVAAIYIGLDKPDPAVDWIEKAWQERDDDLVWLKRDPVYDPVRAHRRFQALLNVSGCLKARFSPWNPRWRPLLYDSGGGEVAIGSGGLTVLMLAAPDLEKMKLLIRRGADANERANNRYSPLLVAAQYSGSSAAMNLLLDHGATVRLPKGQGSPLFNAFPIFLAGFAGNAEIIPATESLLGFQLDAELFL